MDLVVEVDLMPKIGQTIKGGDLKLNPGGKGANQALACALLGTSVSMIGRIGNDIYGKLILENIQKKGINTSGIKIDQTAPTGTALILVDNNGENCIVISSGANANVSIDDVLENKKRISKSKLILLQLEIPIETVLCVIDIANYFNVPVFLNPAPAQVLPIEVFRKIHTLIPNESEASSLTNTQITNMKTAYKSANKLLEFGAKNVILTLGEKGSLIVSNEELIHKSSITVDVVDTTAAGDAFIGGLASSFVKGYKLEDAVNFATYSGALAVTKKGAQQSLPTEEEVKNFINSRTSTN